MSTESNKRKAEAEAQPVAEKKAKVALQEDLIQIADAAIKLNNQIDFVEAVHLWQTAQDGPGVTPNEFATLAHILSEYSFTGNARAYLDPLAIKKASGSSLYRKIKGVKYDRSCMDLADHLAKDGSISQADARLLWDDVMGDGTVTAVEKRTLDYVMANTTLTEGATTLLKAKCAEWDAAEAVRKEKLAAKKAEEEKRKVKFQGTLQKDLIALADASAKTAGVISFDEANKLWKSAEDGPGVTANEFYTLQHILEEYKFTKKARAYLDPLAMKNVSGSSMYKRIDGVRYDRSCMDLAAHCAKDGNISQADAEQLWKDVEDGNRVTKVEKRTIDWVMAKYPLTDGAKKVLDEKIAAWTEKQKLAAAKAAKRAKARAEKAAKKAAAEKAAAAAAAAAADAATKEAAAKAKAEADAAEKKMEDAEPSFVMQDDLIAFAKGAVKSAGVISFAEANGLWREACDGPGVTENEFATLRHILDTYKFTRKARFFLDPMVNVGSSGSSFYKQIDNVKYDRSSLDLAEHYAKDGSISQADAEKLWTNVCDGQGVTKIEKGTIEYVMGKYKLTEGAKKVLDEKIAAWTKANP